MSTNLVIRNVEFRWAKLDKPVSPFGSLSLGALCSRPN